MNHSSHWERNLSHLDDVPTTRTLPPSVDIVIVGAGLTGVSLAYHLARCAPTQTVAVLDCRGVSLGASGRNGGIVWPDAAEEFELRSTASMRAALDEHCIDADWAQRGGISVVEHTEPLEGGDGDGDMLLDGVREVDPVTELGAAPGAFRAAYRDDLPAAVSGAKLVCGLANATLAIAAASSGGVTFVAPCRVEGIDASASGVRVATSLGEIRCGRIVVATNGWIPRLLRALRPHFRAVANTVLVSSVVPAALRWPCAVLSCGEGASEVYASTTAEGRIVIGGLRDSGPGTQGNKKARSNSGSGGGGGTWAFAGYERAPYDANIAADLERWLARRFPTLAAAIAFDRTLAWRGVLGFPRDEMPIVGEMPGRHRRVFACGGFCGHGMPRAWGLAQALAQHLVGVPVDEAATLAKFNVARFFRPANLEAYLARKQANGYRAPSDSGRRSGALSRSGSGSGTLRCPFELLLHRLDCASRTLLAPPRYAAHPFVRRMQRRGVDLWTRVPAELRPGGGRESAVPASRALRKRAQLENVLAAALALLPAAAPASGEGSRSVCVDFCSGAGHAGLLIAWALPHTTVVLVDCNAHALGIAARRASKAGLTNIVCVTADVKRVSMADVLAGIDGDGSGGSGAAAHRTAALGIALHACGAATDGAQRCCVEARVPFLLVPCCVGRLSHASGAGSKAKASKANTLAKAAAARAAADAGVEVASDYPKSHAMRAVLSSEEYDVVARAADFALTPNNRLLRDAYTPRELNRRRCKAWLELDRQLWAVEKFAASKCSSVAPQPHTEDEAEAVAQELPFQTLTFLMEPHDASPKNDILLGWCDGRGVGAVVATGQARVDAALERLCPGAARAEEGGEEERGEAHAWMLPATERV